MDSQFLGLFTSDWGMPERMRARCCGYRNFWRAHCGFSDRRITCKRERPDRGQRREREREKENGWLQKTKGVRRRRNSSASLARTEREEGTWGHSNMTSAQRARGKGRYTKRDDSTDRLLEWHRKEPKNLPYMSIPRSSTSFHTLPFPPPSRMMDCT